MQLGLIGMVNNPAHTEREKRILPDDEARLNVDSEHTDHTEHEEGSILKPADTGLEFRASPNQHLRRRK